MTATIQHSLRDNKPLIATIALVLGLIVSPLSFLAHHAVSLVNDTERVATALDPLVESPEVRALLVEHMVTPLEEFLTQDELLQTLVDQAGLPITLPDALDDALMAVLDPLIEEALTATRGALTVFVDSEEFQRSWRQMIAVSHEEIGKAFRGDPDARLDVSETGEVSLSLQPVLEDARASLVEGGLTFFNDLTIPDLRFTVFTIDNIDGVITTYRILDALDPWIILVTLVLLGGGVWWSRNRPLAWLVAGGGVAGGMVLVLLGLWYARGVALPQAFPESEIIVKDISDALAAYPTSMALVIIAVSLAVGLSGYLIESRVSRQKVMS